MNLYEQAQKDIQDIVTNPNEFGAELTLTAPDGSTLYTNGIHTKHHTIIGTDGIPVNSKYGHISFSEATAVAKAYPVRDDSGEVNLTDHLVEVKDSTGSCCKYVIREWYPDETVGLIVCILGDFE